MNKNKVIRTVTLVLLVMSLASCTWEEIKIKMQFSPEVGEVYRIDLVMEQEITQIIEGEEINVDQTIGFGFLLTGVETDESGSVWIDLKYDWVQYQQITPDEIIDFDSRNPPEEIDPLAEGLAVLIGKGYSMKVSSSGEILEVAGIDTMISEIVEDLGVEDESERAQLEEQFKEQFNEDALKEQAGNMFVEYPEGEVRIGDTWTASMESTSLVPMAIETTYTLEAYEDGIANIKAASTIQSDPELSEMDMGTINIRYALSGTQEGTIDVDTSVGISVNSVITQNISGDMIMILGDEEITIPVTMTSNATVKMVED